eukprot:CAMPEP_0184856410 /NCGR_PEP_ID=MMETSP0580-20130426/1604_1 /TAXON_ID=1118495 /ORGANISM="Dactyliosolen fragilissimus" /LENGTH=367 /DNA_ID=CAMNT_0027351429 /DNA_START=162 /DNA_END=1265 /DNA_ORIENTATION=+
MYHRARIVSAGTSGIGTTRRSTFIASRRKFWVTTSMQFNSYSKLPDKTFKWNESRPEEVSIRLKTVLASTSMGISEEERKKRIDILHESLDSLGIDSNDLENAAFRSITTTDGYNQEYGKSAIRAYRTFVNPRPSKVDTVRSENVNVAAMRCARQIDFLCKRHRSHETEWVRHHDNLVGDEGNLKRKQFHIILVLDNIRSAFNVGSIFRTADACGCCKVITTGITPHPKGAGAEKVAKSALGADRIVQSCHFETTKEAINYLRTKRPNMLLVGMETTKLSKKYTEVTYPGSMNGDSDEEVDNLTPGTVLVLGNEVTGVDTTIMPKLDVMVEIPMFGSKNSLNVASCAPVVLYEILRQWEETTDEKLK